MKPKVLMLSAYDAASHRTWRTGLAATFTNFDWTQLALPPRNFAWRIRGNSLLWAFRDRQLLQQHYDLLIATSMVDLAALRGLVPALSAIPTLIYFHENQFAYPANRQQLADTANFSKTNVEPKLVPLYSALCGDEIVFNSHYNRDSFLQGCRTLFKRLPDTIAPEVMAKLNNSRVIPVPLFLSGASRQTPGKDEIAVIDSADDGTGPGRDNAVDRATGAGKIEGIDATGGTGKTDRTNMIDKADNADKSPVLTTSNSILEVVWNHRWEFDKGPDTLLELVRLVVEQGLAMRFHIVGEKFQQNPPEFSAIEELLRRHCQSLDMQAGRFGFVAEADDYQQLLRFCDVALSTAIHDFQGLALQEAIAAGCTPLAPQRLVYPEYLEQQYLYAATTNSPEWLIALQKLSYWQQQKANGEKLPKPTLDRFHIDGLRSEYAAVFERLMSKAMTD